MSTKLILTIDKSVIDQAKKYAEFKGRSLSNLVEDYLKTISDKTHSNDEIELSPIVKSLLGSVKVNDRELDSKKILEDEILKKHLRE